jgi:hypothetical protein
MSMVRTIMHTNTEIFKHTKRRTKCGVLCVWLDVITRNLCGKSHKKFFEELRNMPYGHLLTLLPS